ncbi:MAG: recombinase family protein [Alphaproteobacteria bacterium]|nr:recombinase family protein [Alphaproteobacteria bacterium]
MDEPKKIRCAIYTRKSTEEGLDKEYNTLEAQRDAGMSYIKSQAYQGWVALDNHYDDGGFSGGNMERPALHQLLEDVKQDKIDMIVVYKIDRLTRSLADFSKLIEILDTHKCSFVSVTQNFNTYDSMGRLTLNILLSFAQFEREVGAERIRDKVAASRKRGMWMGGTIPLGYDVVDKKLVINKKEAVLVKLIFDKYCECKSERDVTDFINHQGYRMKARKSKNTDEFIQNKFSNININYILRNPIYKGKVVHKGKIYDGLHKAIISDTQWTLVQYIKKRNRENRFNPVKIQKKHLLQRLVECGCCHHAMVPTHTLKKNKKYEYYVSVRAVKEGYHQCALGSIPAGELERYVLHQIQNVIQSPKMIDEIARQIKPIMPQIGISEIVDFLKEPETFFNKLPPAILREILEMLISKIIVYPDHVTIRLLPLGQEGLKLNKGKHLKISKTVDGLTELDEKICFVKRYGQLKILIPEEEKVNIDTILLQSLIKAHTWQHKIDSGMSPLQLSQKEGLDRSYMARIISLTRLAPDIIEAIIAGKQPPLSLTFFINFGKIILTSSGDEVMWI